MSVLQLINSGSRQAQQHAVTGQCGRDAARELDAWALAVMHLHSLGLPAAVPELAAAQLRRRGIYPDWTTAA